MVWRCAATLVILAAPMGALAETSVPSESVALVGATILDGTGAKPIENGVLIVRAGRIAAVGPRHAVRTPARAEIIDVGGKYVIPGLMDANVHLFLDVEIENLIKYEGRYEDLVLEAAQVALKNGVTTVFDTWGPRQALANARDRIAAARSDGARIFLAGNIIGFDGPISPEFIPAQQLLSSALVDRINALWVQGVGRDLLWRTPQQVRSRVRAYVEQGGVDFIKYGSSGHVNQEFIAFSLQAQQAIVAEAHRAGLIAQAHTTSVESLRVAIEAGATLIQHCETTGPEPIPPQTLKLMVERAVACALMLSTDRHLQWALTHNRRPGFSEESRVGAQNARNLIRSGALIAMATDSGLYRPEAQDNPFLAPMLKDVPDVPTRLGEAHFLWMQAAAEHGLAPMDALLAATRNVAMAYGKAGELGTLEAGKQADLLVLNADPLQDPRNYRSIAWVMKSGKLIERERLPTQRYFQ